MLGNSVTVLTRVRALLETWKFSVYVAVPIASMVYLTRENTRNNIVQQQSYVVYPPEIGRAPTGDEMLQMLEDEREKRQALASGST
mmetsp:Transcript_12731/g.27764  ORF Transcript_12731/g.27764 Transcript_12731/m.27764 type:complete len:86 (+) Transcript_12731:35-292(+)